MGFADWMRREALRSQSDVGSWHRIGVYLYRADGRYPPPTWAETREQFMGMVPKIRQHIDNKLEVRITNGSDHLLFHSTKKGIEWDGIGLSPVLDHPRNAERLGGGRTLKRPAPSWER